MPDRNEAQKSTEATGNGTEAETRRAFLKTVSKGAVKGAVTAPAVAMLLSAATRPAKAAITSGTGCGCGG